MALLKDKWEEIEKWQEQGLHRELEPELSGMLKS